MAGGAALVGAPRAAAQPPRNSPESSRWSQERANNWYQKQGWPVGANYIPSNAVNQLEMFAPGTYDPRRLDIELGWARLGGFTAVRVFLHDLLWAQDHRGFQSRLAQFVAIAARHGIKPLFVLFDSCWDPFPRRARSPRRGPGSTIPVGCKVPAPNASATGATSARCEAMSPG